MRPSSAFTFRLKLLLITLMVAIPSNCFAEEAESVDFTGPQVHGEASNSYKYGLIKGNRDYSFVDEGNNYTGELSLDYFEELESLTIEGSIKLRKTDDTEIEIRKAPHILTGYLRLYDDWLDFTIGDVYVDLSEYVMNRNLEGIYVEALLPQLHTKLMTTVGSANEPDEGVEYERLVFGHRFEHEFNNVLSMNKIVIGENLSYHSDRRGSIKSEEDVAAIRNTVVSIDAQMILLDESMEVTTEWATAHITDSEQVDYENAESGTAFRIGANYELPDLELNYDFERIGPEFYTDSGSATADYYMHYVALDHDSSEYTSISASYRYYHDNVNNQLSTTIRNFVPRITFTTTPFPQSEEDLVKNMKLTSTATYTLRQADNKSTDYAVQNYESRLSTSSDVWSIYTGFSAKHRTDRVSSSDSRYYSAPIGIGKTYTSDHIDFNPRIEYRITYDDQLINQQITRTHGVSASIDLTFFEKWNLYTTYDFEGLIKKDDKFSRSTGLDINLAYQLSDAIKLQLLYIANTLNQNEEFAGGGVRDRTLELKIVNTF